MHWNLRPDILLQDFLIECRIHGSINYGKSSRSWSCKAAPDHYNTTTMFDSWYDVLFMKCCVGFTPDVTGHTPSKKFNICLISPEKTDFCAKVLGIINMFFGKCETSLLLISSGFCLGNLPWMTFLPSLFLIVESWTLNWSKWGLQFFRCCSGFFYNLLDESSLCSWIHFGKPATPGKVHHSVGLLCNLFLKLLSKSN